MSIQICEACQRVLATEPATVTCIVCLTDRVAFEHKRWKDCAEGYAKERARRQELEAALRRIQGHLPSWPPGFDSELAAAADLLRSVP